MDTKIIDFATRTVTHSDKNISTHKIDVDINLAKSKIKEFLEDNRTPFFNIVDADAINIPMPDSRQTYGNLSCNINILDNEFLVLVHIIYDVSVTGEESIGLIMPILCNGMSVNNIITDGDPRDLLDIINIVNQDCVSKVVIGGDEKYRLLSTCQKINFRSIEEITFNRFMDFYFYTVEPMFYIIPFFNEVIVNKKDPTRELYLSLKYGEDYKE